MSNLSSSVCQDFIDNCLTEVDNPCESILTLVLYDHMKFWYCLKYEGIYPSYKDFKNYLQYKNSTSGKNTNCLIYYKIK